jgi:hypothetical protein
VTKRDHRRETDLRLALVGGSPRVLQEDYSSSAGPSVIPNSGNARVVLTAPEDAKGDVLRTETGSNADDALIKAIGSGAGSTATATSKPCPRVNQAHTLRGLVLEPQLVWFFSGYRDAVPLRYLAFSLAALLIGLTYLIGTTNAWAHLGDGRLPFGSSEAPQSR